MNEGNIRGSRLNRRVPLTHQRIARKSCPVTTSIPWSSLVAQMKRTLRRINERFVGQNFIRHDVVISPVKLAIFPHDWRGKDEIDPLTFSDFISRNKIRVSRKHLKRVGTLSRGLYIHHVPFITDRYEKKGIIYGLKYLGTRTLLHIAKSHPNHDMVPNLPEYAHIDSGFESD